MSEYTMFSKYFRVESLVLSRQNIFYFETKKDNLDYSLVINNLISYKKNYAPKVNLLLIVYSHRGHVKKSLLSMPLSFGLPYSKLTYTN